MLGLSNKEAQKTTAAAQLLMDLSNHKVFTFEKQTRFIQMCACDDEAFEELVFAPSQDSQVEHLQEQCEDRRRKLSEMQAGGAVDLMYL